MLTDWVFMECRFDLEKLAIIVKRSIITKQRIKKNNKYNIQKIYRRTMPTNNSATFRSTFFHSFHYRNKKYVHGRPTNVKAKSSLSSDAQTTSQVNRLT